MLSIYVCLNLGGGRRKAIKMALKKSIDNMHSIQRMRE